MLWHIELNFDLWIRFTVLQITLECCPFALIFVGVISLLELRMIKYTVYRTFLLHALIYWAEILHKIMTLFYCTTDQDWMLLIASICVGVIPLFELKIPKIQSCPLFSLTCFYILSWNFVSDFVLINHRSSSIIYNLRKFFVEVRPLLER